MKEEASLFGRKIYLEGVNDSRAEQKIRGMTLQAAYCDELTLFTEDFFSMLLSRLSMPNSKLLGTTNPDSPGHWLMKKYISRKNDLNLKIWDFFLDDNEMIPKEITESMKKEYTGVFYERFILGKWVQAEGLIYSRFANDKSRYIIEKFPIHELQSIHIGVDYGASKSKTAFVTIGFTRSYETLVVLDEFTSLGINSPEKLYENFLNFYRKIQKEYGYISTCYADWGGLGQVITKGLQTYCLQAKVPVKIHDCSKFRIIERINILSRLVGSDRFKILSRCSETIEALSNAVWEDEKDDVRLDDGTVNIDVLDAMEYAFASFIPKISNSFNKILIKFNPMELKEAENNPDLKVAVINYNQNIDNDFNTVPSIFRNNFDCMDIIIHVSDKNTFTFKKIKEFYDKFNHFRLKPEDFIATESRYCG